eukprot:TRINITY_DN19293_c0_g1_i1.p1 TRINITY_DN19293_c0_g1~~TRINITY_DN19293_c0_g1_i1.p1  ORF type:complete len:232 (+),score=42.34 TRINITY_DN19293_c0_g1_i1:59-697(+)
MAVAEATRFEPGDPVDILAGDRWVPGSVIDADGDGYAVVCGGAEVHALAHQIRRPLLTPPPRRRRHASPDRRAATPDDEGAEAVSSVVGAVSTLAGTVSESPITGRAAASPHRQKGDGALVTQQIMLWVLHLAGALDDGQWHHAARVVARARGAGLEWSSLQRLISNQLRWAGGAWSDVAAGRPYPLDRLLLSFPGEGGVRLPRSAPRTCSR